MVFGERIKELRIEHSWTQEYVCEKLNISSGALSRYETGMYEPKSLDLVKDFANLFGVSTDYLLGKSDVRNPEKINIDDADIAFASGVKGLNETNKMIIKNTLEALLAKQEKDNEEKK
jgi:transcriptional regulator with XRE-family HTH domain